MAFVSWERREREAEPTSVSTATILGHPPNHPQATLNTAVFIVKVTNICQTKTDSLNAQVYLLILWRIDLSIMMHYDDMVLSFHCYAAVHTRFHTRFTILFDHADIQLAKIIIDNQG